MTSSVYRMRVQELRRVTIPKAIYEALDLQKGDLVEIVIKKVEALIDNDV